MRGSIIDASTWREISRSARPPTPGTATISFDDTSEESAQPNWILICSALSIGVRSPMAMSLVTLAPPHGTIAVCRIEPSKNTATSVVPPPMSSSTTPRSRSSLPSTAWLEASGSSTRSWTLRPARWMARQMFLAEVTAPVMMCTSASSRTPLIPTGSLMPSWSSTMNSWGMTWMISRSIGIAIALAASTTRSTSAGPISLSLRDTAITPRLLMLRMWSPAIPACTPLTGTPAIRSASSTARWIEATVFSRSTTTPRRNPSLGALPTPTMLSSPGAFFSAMMQEILVVPMSSPTYVLVAWAIPLTSCARPPSRDRAGAHP
jgi:hypothetical protein